MFLYITSIRRKPAMASVLFAGTFAGNPIFKITFKRRAERYDPRKLYAAGGHVVFKNRKNVV